MGRTLTVMAEFSLQLSLACPQWDLLMAMGSVLVPAPSPSDASQHEKDGFCRNQFPGIE